MKPQIHNRNWLVQRFSIFRVGLVLLFILTGFASILIFAIHDSSATAVLTKSQEKSLNPIQIENQSPGTTHWMLTNPAPYDAKTFRYPAIEGYAWTTSAEAGDTIQFSVSTTSPTFTGTIYRMGWYQGKGGRFILSLPNTTGHFYPVLSPNLQTGLVEPNWPVTFAVKSSSTWISGMYMVVLTASKGEQSYIPFIIRSNSFSDYALIDSVNTGQAYNEWGGTSLYSDATGRLKIGRAFKVSFDRPFQENNGAGQFFSWEYPLVRWLEKNGYDVSYLSDLDVQNDPYALQNYRALLIAGHSEYWSKNMRDNLSEAINNGVNLAAFGANDIYRQVRYESRPAGPGIQPLAERVLVCYKDGLLDPYNGKDNIDVATQFRDDPVDRPEQTLLGSMYSSFYSEAVTYPWVVVDASNWIFAGTGLKNGDTLPGLVGYEYDKVYSGNPVPAGLIILSKSPVVDNYGVHDVSNATLYTASSGARVFNAATIEWTWGLDDASFDGIENVVNPTVQKITANILGNFHSDPIRSSVQSQQTHVVSPAQFLFSIAIAITIYACLCFIGLYVLCVTGEFIRSKAILKNSDLFTKQKNL